MSMLTCGCGSILRDNAMHNSIAAIEWCGVNPLVRVAANEEWMMRSKETPGPPTY